MIRPQNSKNSSRIQGKRPAQSLRVHSRVRVKTRQRQRRRVRHHREHVRKSQVQKSHRLRGRFPAQTVKAETAAEHSTTEKRPGTQAQSAAEKPQGVRQEKQQPARAAKTGTGTVRKGKKEQRMTVRQEKIVKQDSPMIVR